MATTAKVDLGVMPISAPGFITTWRCNDVRGVISIYETDPDAVHDIVDPSPFEYVGPHVWVFAAELAEHELVPYKDCWHYFAWFVPVRFQGRIGKFGAFQFADDVTAIMAGRELLGESKKWADFTYDEQDRHVRASVTLHGQTAFEIEVQREPGAGTVDLNAAFLGDYAAAPEGMLKDFNLRTLPSPVPGERSHRQVVVNALELEGDFEPARVTSINVPPVQTEPAWLASEGFDRFPVRAPLAAAYIHGAFTNGCRPGLELIDLP